MIANVDDLGRQAMRGSQAATATAAAAAAAGLPPKAAAHVAAASAAPRPRHAAAPDTLARAPAAALVALAARLPSPQKLDQNFAMSLGARPVERGKLEVWFGEQKQK